MDLNEELITIQRQDHLAAAITCSEDGRLLVAVYRPFDAGSAAVLANLGLNPSPEGGAAMRNNNWEYALDASASSFRHMTATETGQSYKILLGRGTGDLSRLFLNFKWLEKRGLLRRSDEMIMLNWKHNSSPIDQQNLLKTTLFYLTVSNYYSKLIFIQ